MENTDELDFYECKFNLKFFTFRASKLKELCSKLDKLDVTPLEDPSIGHFSGKHEDVVALSDRRLQSAGLPGEFRFPDQRVESDQDPARGGADRFDAGGW